MAKRLSSPPQAVPGSLGCLSLAGCPLPCPCLRQLCPPAAPRASQNGRGARHGGWRAGRAAPAAAPLPVGRPPGLAATELRGCSGNGHPAASQIPGSYKSHLPAGIGGKPGCVGHTGCMGCPGRTGHTRKCAGFLGPGGCVGGTWCRGGMKGSGGTGCTEHAGRSRCPQCAGYTGYMRCSWGAGHMGCTGCPWCPGHVGCPWSPGHTGCP